MKIFSALRKLFTRESKPTNITINAIDATSFNESLKDSKFSKELAEQVCAAQQSYTVFRHLGPPPVSPAEGAYKVGDLWIDNSEIKSGGFSKIYRWNGSSWDEV